MKRSELRREIWVLLRPLLFEYMARNHCSHAAAVKAMTAEVRNTFPLFRGQQKPQKPGVSTLLTDSEWLSRGKKKTVRPKFSMRALRGFFSKKEGGAA